MNRRRLSNCGYLVGAIVSIAALFVFAPWTGTAVGEEFVLIGGGRVEGTLLNADESPRTEYVVELVGGGVITLAADQVEQVLAKSVAELNYEKWLPKMPPTAEGNWLMAEHCAKLGLPEHREFHLNRVIELDPEHEEARRALGYSKVDGVWVIREDEMAARGYVLHKGRWRLPQDIAMEEAQQKRQDEEVEWGKKVRRWHGWLDGQRAAEGAAQLRALKEPAAAPTLVTLLEKAKDPAIKLVLIRTLGQLDHPAATAALIERALEDDDEPVRDAAVDQLMGRENKSVVRRFIAALKSKDNVQVNRAAIALGRLGDPEAVRPLIGALVTKHRFLVQGGSGSGQIGAGFGNVGPGGLSVGGKPKLIEKELRNGGVLAALSTLTPVNFGYSEDDWNAWYTAENTPKVVTLRRDE